MILAALLVFRLAGETVSPLPEAAVPRPVGSLQKPWVVAAWGAAHPDEEPPLLSCTPADRCWRPSGHGRVDLARAFAHSCNAYFLALARATPEELRARALADAGFEVPRPLSPEASIGLGPLDALPRVSPAALLRAYRDLRSRPWPSRDDLRLRLVDGMRAAALEGTGAALASRGYLVKTGTVPSLDGRELATSGWALASSAGGESLALALLSDGTGAEAAAALGRELGGDARRSEPRQRPAGKDPPPLVRIRLLDALRASRVSVSNAGDAPIALRRPRSRREWLGPGASLAAEPGFSVGPGLLRLDVAPYGLVRFFDGTVEVAGGADSPRVVLSATPRAWVDGVLRGSCASARRSCSRSSPRRLSASSARARGTAAKTCATPPTAPSSSGEGPSSPGSRRAVPRSAPGPGRPQPRSSTTAPSSAPSPWPDSRVPTTSRATAAAPRSRRTRSGDAARARRRPARATVRPTRRRGSGSSPPPPSTQPSAPGSTAFAPSSRRACGRRA